MGRNSKTVVFTDNSLQVLFIQWTSCLALSWLAKSLVLLETTQ